MIKNILVPTDFSEQAESALNVAAQIARKNNSKIYLLHVLELPLHLTDLMSSNNPAPAPEAIFFMKHAHNKFEEMLSAEHLKDLDIEETVSFEGVMDGIIDASEKNNVDMIIMGSHGSSGFEELFIGSNAEKIVRTSKKPVLVVKEECDIYNIKDFVYATNFDDEDRDSLMSAYDFAKLINAKLHLVWVNTANGFKTTKDTQDKMHHFLEGMHLENHTLNIYNDVTVEKGIFNFADSVNAGLIGISTHEIGRASCRER